MDPRSFAEAIVRAGYQLPGETAVRIDVGTFDGEFVRAIFDGILRLAPSHDLRLRGVRTDTASFNKLGISMDTVNSGIYEGITVVITSSAHFDTMEFVLFPTKIR